MIGGHTVTLIAALHNAEGALRTFLAQVDEASDIVDEVVLIDDASKDATWETISRWSASRPGPAHMLHNPVNRGVAASRNTALRHATGEFIWFVDHDDHWSSDVLRRLQRPQEHTDVLWFRAEYRTRADQPGRYCDGLPTASTEASPTAINRLLSGEVDGFLWSKLFRRTVIPDDPFPMLTSQSDIVGVTRILVRSRYIQFVPETLYHWLHRPGSITRTRTPNLANLELAHQLVIDTLPTRSFAGAARLQLFTAWFCCRAMIITPIRTHADRANRRDGFRRARDLLSAAETLTIARTAPALAALLTAARISPVITTATLRSMYLGLDLARRLRSGVYPATE